MEPIIIDYPQFPEEIMLSEERRAKYFIRGKETDKYPQKYFANGVPLKGYSWRSYKGRWLLYDEAKKLFVVKNSLSAGTPRYVSIAGNDIMRMFEHTRNKIINTLKEFFIHGVGDPLQTDARGGKASVMIKKASGSKWALAYKPKHSLEKFPINIYMEIHTFPHYMNWDLDNLWVYNKCFQDAMTEVGMIPEDNIRYITWPGAPRFIPVSREEERKIRFVISLESDPRILNHIMYWSVGKKFDFALGAKVYGWGESPKKPLFGDLLVSTDYHAGKPGDIMIESSKTMVGYVGWMNIGRKADPKNIRKGLERIRHQCYQLNCIPTFDGKDYVKMETDIQEVFMQKGIPVKIA